MATIAEQIQAIEDEIFKTQKNKATEHHIGKLKAKLARLRQEEEKRASSGKAGVGYSIKKSGNATVGLVGFPSVGKSTLLNKITDAKSEIGAYEFTTLDVVPGVMHFGGANIQILDLPGLIKGAHRGKGRGREVLSVVRSADLIILLLDVFETNYEILVRELWHAGIRLNQRPADINISKKERGGIEVHTTLQLTKIDEEMVVGVASEYGLINADIVIREDIDEDQLIDFLSGNRIYIPAFAVVNKIDMADEQHLKGILKGLRNIEHMTISAEEGLRIPELKQRIFDTLEFIRIFMKPQRQKADMVEPLVIKKGSTVEMVCNTLHRDFARKFRYSLVTGPSAKYPNQMVGLGHVLEDGDILTVVVRRS